MSTFSRREFVKTAAAASAIGLTSSTTNINARAESGDLSSNSFHSDWQKIPNRIWTGPETWANPWEDWCIEDGKLTCISQNHGKRNVHCLTHQLGDKIAGAEISVVVSSRDFKPGQKKPGEKGKTLPLAGFEIGIRVKDPIDDYRSRLLSGSGLPMGITERGELLIGRKSSPVIAPLAEALKEGRSVRLDCKIQPQSDKDKYTLVLTASSASDNKPLGSITLQNVPADKLSGNIALIINRSKNAQDGGPAGIISFSDWTIEGEKITSNPNQSFGPILWTLYTLSNDIMKMTAQMPPLGKNDDQNAQLQIESNGSWKTIATAKIDEIAKTATFRVPDWDDAKDIPYRVCWTQKYNSGGKKNYTHSGTIRKDPKDKPEIVVAGYCCFGDSLFPNVDIASQTAKQNPDIMFFVGDQIYEFVGGYGIRRRGDISLMMANYLRKLALLGWSFRELTKDRPTIWIPDDHDVYHGNVWGASGRKISVKEWNTKSGYADSINYGAKGGYVQPAEFVKAVERTQTAHLPDPYDPTPIGQDIGVYYCGLNYGRVSFAILEDRKFKSGPMSVYKHKSHRPDWLVDKQAALDADVPGAKLLGDRQLKFLADWAEDWRGADMKIAVSQTIFCNAATHHGGPADFLVADMDSNGWPQTGRNLALDIIRRSYALMLAGDQHLPTIIQHGIKKHRDAGFSLCVPAGSNIYQRWWRPEEIDEMTRDGERHDNFPNTGKYHDGFDNLIDVHAVANPTIKKTSRNRLQWNQQTSSGYGIVRVNKAKGTFTLEAWQVGDEQNKQFPGWPITVSVDDNSGTANPQLPPVALQNWTKSDLPVVKVTDAEGNLVTIARMPEKTFAPRVFDADGKYTVQIFTPEENSPAGKVLKTFKDVSVGQPGELKL